MSPGTRLHPRIPFEETLWKGHFRVGKLDRSEYQSDGPLPVIDQGQNDVAGYTSRMDLVYQGPLPVVIFGDHTRAFKYVDRPFVAGADGTKVLVPDTKKLDPLFYFFALEALKLPSRGYNRHYALLREQSIPLPPLEEQRRIARILSTIQRAQEARLQRGAALSAVSRSALENLLGNGADQSSWVRHLLPDVIDYQEGPGVMAADFRDQGVPLIRLAGVTDGVNLLAGCNYLDPEEVARRWTHFRLELGDTLLSSSASLGRVAVVNEAAVGAIGYTGIIRMRPRDGRVAPEFIRFLLSSPGFQKQAQEAGIGTVMRHFGPSHLKAMTVSLPPAEEQRRIARVLHTMMRAQQSHAASREDLAVTFNSALRQLLGTAA